MIVVYPENVWYQGVAESDLPRSSSLISWAGGRWSA
jgi:(2Fe-2S) ferredoxin